LNSQPRSCPNTLKHFRKRGYQATYAAKAQKKTRELWNCLFTRDSPIGYSKRNLRQDGVKVLCSPTDWLKREVRGSLVSPMDKGQGIRWDNGLEMDILKRK
jgi:hypothetical protein